MHQQNQSENDVHQQNTEPEYQQKHAHHAGDQQNHSGSTVCKQKQRLIRMYDMCHKHFQPDDNWVDKLSDSQLRVLGNAYIIFVLNCLQVSRRHNSNF